MNHCYQKSGIKHTFQVPVTSPILHISKKKILCHLYFVFKHLRHTKKVSEARSSVMDTANSLSELGELVLAGGGEDDELVY